MIEMIRSRIERDVFDYQTLMQVLSDYSSPRDVVTRLLRSEKIIRIKKGLYIFNETYRRNPYERGLLANLIYGPSMVSLEYALAYHGLIPERVEEITSVSTGRSKRFETPVGRYSYRLTPCLSPGIQQVSRGGQVFLMASPERALADKLRDDRHGGSLRTLSEIQCYLFENLRIDSTDFMQLDVTEMAKIAKELRSEKVRLCAAFLRRCQKRGNGL